jgi:23S rRNA (adenine2503-C2)-methyltransferase
VVLVEAVATGATADPAEVERLARVLACPPSVRLLHATPDPRRECTVFTALGEPDALADALIGLARRAAQILDLRTSRTGRGRLGVLDEVSLVAVAWPEGESARTTSDRTADLARELARRLAEEAGVTAVLHGDADPGGRTPAELAEGGADRLFSRIDAGDVEAFLPARPPEDGRARTGVTRVGARRPAVSFDVELATAEIGHARKIAGELAAGGGRLPTVEARGTRLGPDRVQVSVVLANPGPTSVEDAWTAMRDRAGAAGIALGPTRLVGLVPRGTWPAGLGERVGEPDVHGAEEERRWIESWLPGGPLAEDDGLFASSAREAATEEGAADTRLRLLDLPLVEATGALRGLLEEMGERPFRASQVVHALHSRRHRAFDDMTELPRALRADLGSRVRLGLLDLVERAQSEDGTVKYLWGLPDAGEIESVAIPSERRTTFCVSSQVGCALRCRFCATGQLGLTRNLTPGEVVDQVLAMLADGRQDQESLNVVFMGQGEPGYNLDAVLAAIRMLNDPQGLSIGARHVTVSTAGVVPAIRRLAAEPLQVRLAVSLHTGVQATRASLMNVAERHPLPELLEACQAYHDATRRFVTFEVAVMPGVNDSPAEIAALAAFADRVPSKINLIPYNPVADFEAAAGTAPRAAAFRDALVGAYRGEVVVRRTRGRDIQAACGMLHRHRARHAEAAAEHGGGQAEA